MFHHINYPPKGELHMHKLFFKQLQKLIGVFFLLETLIGILIIVKNITNIIQVIAAAIVSIMFGTLSFLLLKNDSSKKKVKNSDAICADKPQERDYSKQTEYVQDGNVIYRADGKKISDEEVPYLMQVGYENALAEEKNSSNPKFHRSFKEEELSYSFENKYYNEIAKRIEKFETPYHNSFSEQDLSKKIMLLEQSITEFDKCKNFCYSKGKGGTIYFQDMYEYLHNTHNDCFSYRDMILGSLEECYYERDELIPEIKNAISNHNGILQKNIYAELPDFQRSDIQRMLRKLESENVITRIKKSGSYELHLN
jgi:hypothetical protein|nr:MAG TPA: linker histone H1 and H5 family [Caudoviricetes sp.]